MSTRGVALFVAMAVLWGIPYLLIRVAVDELSPELVVFGRCLVGALVLLPFALRDQGVRRVLARWRAVLPYAVVEVAAPWFLLSDAERHLTSSLAGVLIATTPLIAAVVALVLRSDDRLGVRQSLGLLVGFAGVVALVGIDLGDAFGLWPVVQVLLTATGYAIGPVIVSRSLSDLPPVATNAVVLGLCALGYAPFAVAGLPSTAPSTEAVAAVVALGLLCTALAFVLYFALIAEVGPARSTVITYVSPAVALAAGVLVLDEPLTAGIAVGFPLVLLGCVLATRRPPRTTARARRAAAATDVPLP